MRPDPNHSRGTVSLVALCFVAVLGIALSSYLAICTRSMTLSNRSFQSGLSQQLAELGLEEGLRAFNKGDWSDWSNGISVDWDILTYATNKRAVATVTFPAGKFGQGITATVKIRVDNYDANVLGSTYNSSVTYRLNDIVYYSTTGTVATGNWYRCIATTSSGNAPTSTLGYPNLIYWAPVPIQWMWDSSATYSQNDFVCYVGVWYVCTTGPAPAGTLPTSTSYWTRATASPDPSAPVLAITTLTSYYNGQFGFRVGDSNWYRCNTSFTSTGSWDASKWTAVNTTFPWAYNSSKSYYYNDLVFYSGTAGVAGTWYRCIVAGPTSSAPTTASWENALTGANTTSLTGAHGWSSSSINYNVGDVVCYYTSSTYNFYRCIRDHTSSGAIAPTNTTYWSNAPLLSQDWQPNHQYSQYDTVRYKGVWYLSLTSTNNFGKLPTDASSGYWAAAPLATLSWNSTSYYELDDLVNNSGTWYRCIAPHKSQSPPNATYWTVLTGSGSSYVWNGATAYTVGSYRSYGGVWYKCLTATSANDGRTPNDSVYWTPTWSQPSTAITTGAPVVYAEATITITGNPPLRSQLRAAIAPASLFPNAVGSTSTLIMNSAGTVDSFDGSVRSMNPGGTTATYVQGETATTPFTATNSNVGFTASVAATGTSSPSLTVTSATIKGYAAASPASTTPFAPLASFGNAAYLQNSDGTTTSPDTTATQVDLSRISRSPYVPQFDPQPSGELSTAFSAANFPRGSAIPISITGDVVLGIPGAVSPARYSFDGDLVIGSGGLNTLTIIGPVILYINGNLQVSNSATNVLNIDSTGSAEIHLADSLMIAAAGFGISNKTLDPKKLIIICHTATASTQYYQDVGAFYGVIYAPYTTNSTGLNLNNAVSTPFFGALSAAKVEFANNATVHYDTSLRYATFGGVDQPYTVTSWRELPVSEQATMP